VLPNKKEIKNSQRVLEIISNDTIPAICPICHHEVRIRKDDGVHCLGCLMKGTVSVLIPKIIKKNKKNQGKIQRL
jgi:hypothetical protein